MKNWNMPGWAFGASYGYAWDASRGECPRLMRTTTRINAWKSAYSLDAMYAVQEGRAKGTLFKLRFTQYDHHSDIPSWAVVTATSSG